MNTVPKTTARGCGNWLEHARISTKLGAISCFRVAWGAPSSARAVEGWQVSYTALYRPSPGGTGRMMNCPPPTCSSFLSDVLTSGRSDDSLIPRTHFLPVCLTHTRFRGLTQTPNTKHQTLNPKPQTPNTKPHIPNPPTLKPKPFT